MKKLRKVDTSTLYYWSQDIWVEGQCEGSREELEVTHRDFSAVVATSQLHDLINGELTTDFHVLLRARTKTIALASS